MENFARKIGPWVPLLIAAGYFIFLISTWAMMSRQMALFLKMPEPIKDKPDDDTAVDQHTN